MAPEWTWRCPIAEQTRIVLCDDHAVLRAGLRRILADEPDLRVVGEAGDATEGIAVVETMQPDVLVLDLGLPGADGLQVARRIRQAGSPPRILVLTMYDDVAYLRRAFDAGATGYLLKEAADVELVRAIRVVADGGQYVHPSLGAALLSGEPARTDRPGGPGGRLSHREAEVLRLIALGHTNVEVAATLYLSVRTVETHRLRIAQKLGAHTRAELVGAARDAGLLDAATDGLP